jgi:hypothetical protein
MKLTITLALFVGVIAGICLGIQRRSQAASREKTIALAAQSEQITDLQAKQQRLSSHVADSTNAATPAADRQTELTRLRMRAESLRKQTNRFVNQSTIGSTPTAGKSAPESHPPEYWQDLHQAAGTKPVDARDIAAAAYYYAREHKNQVPTNIDQITKYFSDVGRTKPPTNRFEFVFTGSLDQLKGIPNTSVAIVRDTETWTTSDGKQARVYGMIGGLGQIVTSDDNFQSWEAEHVISGPSK